MSKKKTPVKKAAKKAAKPDPTKPTIANARKVIEVVSEGLSCGIGERIPGRMCVEAAVCYAMGEPHSDRPKCVGELVRNSKIALNDGGKWKDKNDRADGLLRVAIAQLGSNKIDQTEYGNLLIEKIVRRTIKGHLTGIGISPVKAKNILRFYKEGGIQAMKNEYVQNAGAYALYNVASYKHIHTTATGGFMYWMELAVGQAINMAVRMRGGSRIAARMIEETLTELKSPGVKWLRLLD
jgi:hypothetical protein